MTRRARTRSKLAAMLMATLAGGSLFASCQTRLRDAAVQGTKNYLFGVLDPNVFIDRILDTSNE